MVVGAGGLGTAVARRLDLSHRLLVADRDGDHAPRRCAAFRSDGYDAVTVTCDVIQPADTVRLVKAASARPAVRTLANVVGLFPVAKDFHAIRAVNLIGAGRIAEAFDGIDRHTARSGIL